MSLRGWTRSSKARIMPGSLPGSTSLVFQSLLDSQDSFLNLDNCYPQAIWSKRGLNWIKIDSGEACLLSDDLESACRLLRRSLWELPGHFNWNFADFANIIPVLRNSENVIVLYILLGKFRRSGARAAAQLLALARRSRSKHYEGR